MRDTGQNPTPVKPPHRMPSEASTSVARAPSVESSGGLLLPLSGAAAAALLDGSTMFEALALPANASSFSLPVPAHKTPPAAVQAAYAASAAAQANYTKLQKTALPLLFAFAEQQLSLHALHKSALDTADHSGPPPFSSEALDEAVQCLAVHVENIRRAAHRDGRRHVAALPPPVVAALWDHVMPLLHAHVFPRSDSSSHRGQHASEGVSDEAGPANGVALLPESTAAASATHESRKDTQASSVTTRTAGCAESYAPEPMSLTQTAPAPAPVAAFPQPFPPSSQLKASYLAVRRVLALHTRSIAPLFPSDVLALVLTRLYQCGALSDDVLGPVLSEWMVNAEQNASDHPSSANSSPAASTSATVGGTISILQRRVLRLDGAWRADGTAVQAFTGASAVTMARLLGKAAIPGHHSLHRFFHLALLPEVTRVLRSATALTAAEGIEVNAQRSKKTAEAGGDVQGSEGAVVDVAAVQPGADALLDLTAAFRHYAVSGEAVTHLTSLWHLHFRLATRSPSAWADCAAVLQALSTLPVASTRSQRRQSRQLPHTSSKSSMSAGQDKLLLRVAEEDYYPLVEEVCAQLRQLSEAAIASPGSADGQLGVRNSEVTQVVSPVSPSQLLNLLRMLLRVNSPHWAETYEALATAIFVQVTSQLPACTVTASSPSMEFTAVDVQTVLNSLLPLVDTQRTVKALLHRNSLIPDHPLHRLLLRRLLYATEALTDATVAATALLGLEVMIPAEEGSVMPSPSPSFSSFSSLSPEVSPTSAAVVQAAPAVDFSVTAYDRARALQLLRRFGRSMSATAFVAGLCVAPLHELSLPTQTALVNHLSAVASAVSPTYLVKGMAALMTQLNPVAIDAVSVQNWYSRFTAVDVVRRVDSTGCAVLLDLLSTHPRFELNCTLAKQAITRRLGVALLRSGDEDAVVNHRHRGGGGGGADSIAGVSAALSLEQLPQVVGALRHANVFYPSYFSRVCRMLLGQVESAPLGDLLVPFGVTAEEFMRRQQREGQASLFKDVWELLRGRVLEQAATLTLEETCTALSAFAALDVRDNALFGVLVFQLWTCVQQAVAAGGEMRPLHEKTAADAEGVQEIHVMNGEAQEAAARRLAQLGQHITQILSPSAVAVVTATLCARAEQQQLQQRHTTTTTTTTTNSSNGNASADSDAIVQTMLPWMLLSLQNSHAELYPIDVVHVLPFLLQRYTAATATQASSATVGVAAAASTRSHGEERILLSLLHATYDACRTTFLSMYAILPDLAVLADSSAATAAAAAGTGASRRQRGEDDISSSSTLTDEEIRLFAEQRAAWTPAVTLSVQVVPRSWFATILLALSSAGVADVDVGLACVARACTRRVCASQLPIDQLVDVCLTMCWLFRLSDVATDRVEQASTTARQPEAEEDTDTGGKETAEREYNEKAELTGTAGIQVEVAATTASVTTATAPSTTAPAILRSAMSTVLSALWFRSDELGISHVNALLRCLRDTYGTNRVDVDFVQRLEEQRARILEQKEKADQAAAAAAAAVTAGEQLSASSPPSAGTSTHESSNRNSSGHSEDSTRAERAQMSSAAAKRTNYAPAPPSKMVGPEADDLFSIM